VELERANEILKAASAWFAGELDPTTVMSFVAAHRDLFGSSQPPGAAAPRLDLLRLGAQQRDPCRRRRDDQALTSRIRRIHHRSGQTYGAPRIHARLRRDGVQVSRKRVARLLGATACGGRSCASGGAGRPARTLRRPRPRTWSAATSGPRRPTGGWVADICPIPTGEGPLWLASVRDGFSRRIVGWKASDRADVELVLGALEDAIWGRGLDGDRGQHRLIHHSDRGAQSTAIRFTQRLADARIQPCMGSVGDSFDNALAENFLLHPQGRAGLPHHLPDPGAGRAGPVLLHRRLVGPPPHPAHAWLAEPRRVRGGVPHRQASWQPGFTCRRQVTHPPRKRGNPKQP
jgi:putative transposase